MEMNNEYNNLILSISWIANRDIQNYFKFQINIIVIQIEVLQCCFYQLVQNYRDLKIMQEPSQDQSHQVQNEFQIRSYQQQKQSANHNSQNSIKATSANQDDALSMYINADETEQKKVWLLRILVLLILVLILTLKLALPSTFVTLTNTEVLKENSKTCNPVFDVKKQIICNNLSSSNPKLGLILKDMSVQHQFLLFYFQVSINETDYRDFVLNQSIQIQSFQLKMEPNGQSNNTNTVYISQLLYNQTGSYTVNYKSMQVTRNKNSIMIMRYLFAYDRISLKQSQQNIDLLVTTRFTDLSPFDKVNSIQMNALTINPKFTYFTIVIRAVYCLISVVTGIIFVRRYCQIEPSQRILEVRLVGIGSVFLILFNDPFYAITILKVNSGSTFFSSMFVVVMLVFLLFLFMFFIRRIYYEPEQKSTQLFNCRRSWPFYLMTFLLFGSISALYLQYAYYAFQNIPIIIPSNIQQMKAIPTVIIVSIFVGFCVIYQIVMIVRICIKYLCGKTDQSLPQRHKKYLTFYPVFLVSFIVFFAGCGWMPYNYEGAWILYGYSFLNIFMLLLQFLYYTSSDSLNNQKEPSRVFDTSSINSNNFENSKKKQKRYDANHQIEQN